MLMTPIFKALPVFVLFAALFYPSLAAAQESPHNTEISGLLELYKESSPCVGFFLEDCQQTLKVVDSGSDVIVLGGDEACGRQIRIENNRIYCYEVPRLSTDPSYQEPITVLDELYYEGPGGPAASGLMYNILDILFPPLYADVPTASVNSIEIYKKDEGRITPYCSASGGKKVISGRIPFSKDGDEFYFSLSGVSTAFRGKTLELRVLVSGENTRIPIAQKIEIYVQNDGKFSRSDLRIKYSDVKYLLKHLDGEYDLIFQIWSANQAGAYVFNNIIDIKEELSEIQKETSIDEISINGLDGSEFDQQIILGEKGDSLDIIIKGKAATFRGNYIQLKYYFREKGNPSNIEEDWSYLGKRAAYVDDQGAFINQGLFSYNPELAEYYHAADINPDAGKYFFYITVEDPKTNEILTRQKWGGIVIISKPAKDETEYEKKPKIEYFLLNDISGEDLADTIKLSNNGDYFSVKHKVYGLTSYQNNDVVIKYFLLSAGGKETQIGRKEEITNDEGIIDTETFFEYSLSQPVSSYLSSLIHPPDGRYKLILSIENSDESKILLRVPWGGGSQVDSDFWQHGILQFKREEKKVLIENTRVNFLLGTKNDVAYIKPGKRVDIRFGITNALDYTNEPLTVRYYLISQDILEPIEIGKKSDIRIDESGNYNLKDNIIYDPSLTELFSGSRMNPFSNLQVSKTNKYFKFRIDVLDNQGNMLASEIWGGGNSETGKWSFDVKPTLEKEYKLEGIALVNGYSIELQTLGDETATLRLKDANGGILDCTYYPFDDSWYADYDSIDECSDVTLIILKNDQKSATLITSINQVEPQKPSLMKVSDVIELSLPHVLQVKEIISEGVVKILLRGSDNEILCGEKDIALGENFECNGLLIEPKRITNRIAEFTLRQKETEIVDIFTGKSHTLKSGYSILFKNFDDDEAIFELKKQNGEIIDCDNLPFVDEWDISAGDVEECEGISVALSSLQNNKAKIIISTFKDPVKRSMFVNEALLINFDYNIELDEAIAGDEADFILRGPDNEIVDCSSLPLSDKFSVDQNSNEECAGVKISISGVSDISANYNIFTRKLTIEKLNIDAPKKPSEESLRNVFMFEDLGNGFIFDNVYRDYVNFYMPVWLRVYNDGKYSYVGPAKNKNTISEIIKKAHDNNMKVIPVVQAAYNAYDAIAKVLKDEKSRERYVNYIYKSVIENDFDGINIDFESIKTGMAGFRDEFTDFVCRLYEKLKPEGKLLTIDAPPELPYGDWKYFWDASELSACSDYYMIMMYDLHKKGYWSGPVTPIDEMRTNLKLVLTKVDKDKVVVLLPFYGYYKRQDMREGKNVGSPEILRRSNGIFEYELVGHEAYYRNETYFGYFQTSYSTKKKLEVLDEFSLTNVGFWQHNQALYSEENEELQPVIAISQWLAEGKASV